VGEFSARRLQGHADAVQTLGSASAARRPPRLWRVRPRTPGAQIYHAGDSAYFDGFKQIGKHFAPEIALLPIGAYRPESFRNVHMGPDEAIKVFHDIRAQTFVPMHYGTFRLSFEDMDEPPRWLRQLAADHGISHCIRMLEEGVPEIF
jgi:L-ascorbate metabolism protein UlaG (beta-lactamase superfamily)